MDATQEISLDEIKFLADKHNHVIMPRPSSNKLRRLARCADSIAGALSKVVLEETTKNGVNAKEWSGGIQDELISWMSWVDKGLKKDEEGFRQSFLLDVDFKFVDDIPQTGSITALDIGCAMRAGLGKRLPGRDLSIIAADPLASAYDTILDLYGISRGYTLEWAVAEMTADIFGEDHFNFILANNSIDHGYDPRLAFEQISKALKVGGVSRCFHWVNEAEFEKYQGFHQWNLEPNGNKLRVWNREHDTLIDFGDFGCAAEVSLIEKPPRGGVYQPAFAIKLVKG